MKESDRKKYDLEERTFLFAKNIRSFVRKLPKTIANKVNKNILFCFGFRYSNFGFITKHAELNFYKKKVKYA